jgi:hypothetical protein
VKTITIGVADDIPDAADLIRRYGDSGRLEIGGFLGPVIPVRIIADSDRSEQDRRPG